MMKSEVLRIYNGGYESKGITYLKGLMLQVIEGELISISPVNDFGLLYLIDLFVGEIELTTGKIYLGKDHEVKRLPTTFAGYVYTKTTLIPRLNIANNLFLMKRDNPAFFINSNNLEDEIAFLFNKIGLDVSPKAFPDDLTEIERIMVEIAALILTGSRVIVLREVTKALNSAQVRRLMEVIDYYRRYKVSFIYIGSYPDTLFLYCERLLLFDKGSIRKIFSRNDLSEGKVSDFFLGRARHNLQIKKNDNGFLLEIDFFSEGIRIEKVKITTGKCYAFIGDDTKWMNEMKDILYHSLKNDNGKNYRTYLLPELSHEKILFYNKSFQFNLNFEMQRKLRQWFIPKKIFKSIRQELPLELLDNFEVQNIDTLNVKELYELVFLRVLIYKPDVCILIQPILEQDQSLKTHILSLIDHLKKRGITIFIVTTVRDHWEGFADEIIDWKKQLQDPI